MIRVKNQIEFAALSLVLVIAVVSNADEPMNDGEKKVP
jgi:hypothetical protein